MLQSSDTKPNSKHAPLTERKVSSYAHRRVWRQPWNWSTRTWFVAALIGCLLSPAVTRWICLWQVPDVVLPFDVESVIRDDIPKDEDAMVGYAKALRFYTSPWNASVAGKMLFQTPLEFYDAESEAVGSPTGKWDGRFDDWLGGMRPAIDEFHRASRMPRSSGPSLRTADFETSVGWHQDLRQLTRLIELEAARLQRNGEFDAAWNCHVANLHSARHCQMPRFMICHLIGVGIRAYTYRGIARWAEYAQVTDEQLRSARQELVVDRETAVPASELLKANYLLLKNGMLSEDMPNRMMTFWRMAQPESKVTLFSKKLALWTIGQPELMLRLARQTLINNGDQMDLPLYLRRHSDIVMQRDLVFDDDLNQPRLSRQLPSHQLLSSLEVSFKMMDGMQGEFLDGQSVDQANRNDEARRRALEIVLAAHQYQRSLGEFPVNLAQLVPTFLTTIPIDPMDARGASLRYRREENGDAIVWSIGHNNMDDGGDINPLTSKDTGFPMRLNSLPVVKSDDPNVATDNQRPKSPKRGEP